MTKLNSRYSISSTQGNNLMNTKSSNSSNIIFAPYVPVEEISDEMITLFKKRERLKKLKRILKEEED
jgi:hypothetical protein